MLKLIHPQTYNGVSNSTLFLDQEYSRNIHLSIQLAMLLFKSHPQWPFIQSINQSINQLMTVNMTPAQRLKNIRHIFSLITHLADESASQQLTIHPSNELLHQRSSARPIRCTKEQSISDFHHFR